MPYSRNIPSRSVGRQRLAFNARESISKELAIIGVSTGIKYTAVADYEEGSQTLTYIPTSYIDKAIKLTTVNVAYNSADTNPWLATIDVSGQYFIHTYVQIDNPSLPGMVVALQCNTADIGISYIPDSNNLYVISGWHYFQANDELQIVVRAENSDYSSKNLTVDSALFYMFK